MSSIEVRHLSKVLRGGKRILDDVTFSYDGAGAVGYLGANGAGKTTTLKLLVGLLRPTKGEALLNGHDVRVDRKEALRDVGALIETPEPYPTQTVFEALETVGRLRGLSRESIASEFDRVHEELKLVPRTQRCGGLSKGQRQRVVLAAALLGNPSVLLLDEPTSGLDPAERVLVRGLLGRLKKDHLILLVSHQIVDVAEICDDLLFLDRGRLILQGTVAEVSSRIRSRQIEVELQGPLAPDALQELKSLAQVVLPLSDRAYRLTFDGTHETRAKILETCQRRGTVLQFSNAFPALEEAYLEVLASSEAAK